MVDKVDTKDELTEDKIEYAIQCVHDFYKQSGREWRNPWENLVQLRFVKNKEVINDTVD